ncbi:hypothetical protein HDV02_001750 [Globomyces sp. JEL0801]|nr:hypothetical protein HDV02_001750 [Globomyces sp. JEL0801]
MAIQDAHDKDILARKSHFNTQYYKPMSVVLILIVNLIASVADYILMNRVIALTERVNSSQNNSNYSTRKVKAHGSHSLSLKATYNIITVLVLIDVVMKVLVILDYPVFDSVVTVTSLTFRSAANLKFGVTLKNIYRPDSSEEDTYGTRAKSIEQSRANSHHSRYTTQSVNVAKATVTRLTNKNELLEMEKNERKRTVHKPGKSHQRRHTINGSLSEKDRMVLYKNLKKNNNFIAFNVESIYTSEKKLVGHQSSPALILIDANRYIQKQHVRSMFEVGYREKNQKPNIHEKSTQPPEQARKSTGLKIDIPTIGLITDQGDSLILQHRHDPLTRTKSPFGFTDSDLSNHKSQTLKSELSFSNTTSSTKISQISPLTQRKSHTNFSTESSTTNSNNLLANNLADYRPVSPNSLASASISNVEAGAFGLPSVLNDSNLTSYHTLTKPMSVDSPELRRSRGRSPSFTRQSTTSSFPCVIQEGAIISHQFEAATTQHDFPPPKTHRSSSYMRFVTTDSFPTVKNENQSNSRPNVHTDHFLDLNQRLIKMINDDSNNATSFSPTAVNNEEMVEWPTANSPMVKPNTEHNSKPLLSVKANDGIGIRSRANSNVRGSTVDNRSRATSISNDSIEGDNMDIKNHFYTRGRRNTKTESTKSSNDTLSGYPSNLLNKAADDPMIGERLTSIKLYEDLTKNSIKISKEKLVKAICGPRDYKKKLIDVHIQKEKVEEDKLIKHKMDQYRRKMFIEKERCETFKRSRSTKLVQKKHPQI